MLARRAPAFRSFFDKDTANAGQGPRRGKSGISETDVAARRQWFFADGGADDRRMVRRSSDRRRDVELAQPARGQVRQALPEREQGNRQAARTRTSSRE